MKKNTFIALIVMVALLARAQMQTIDLTTLHTNTYVTTAYITIFGVCTNLPYYTTNYVVVTSVDPPSTIGAKFNSNVVYLTNQLALMLQLPNQINTNLIAQINAVSNRVNTLTANLSSVSNFVNTATLALTNRVLQLGTDATNGYLAMGLDLTNRLDDIKQAGSSGSETVLKNNSPDGTIWYWHTDNSGVQSITGSP